MTTQETPEYPVDDFKNAAPLLRRPFTAGAVKWKVQATAGKKGLIVGYIDARLVVERLNMIVPHLWYDEYERLDGKVLGCRLTIDGITRQDVGEGSGIGKAIYSDALKRAAVKFGVGVSLYAMKAIWLSAGAHLTEGKNKKGETVLTLTDKGEAHLRELYGKWLTLDRGGKVFGEPLDHGDDPEGSVGEVETEPVVEPEQSEFVDEKRFKAQQDEAEKLYAKLNGKQKDLTPGAFTALMNAAKTHEDMDAVIARVKELQS